MQIDYVKISCKEDAYICRTNFPKQMERNLHETTSRWKTYGKCMFSKDLEVRDVYNMRANYSIISSKNYNFDERSVICGIWN
jgi:hypothetical protein